MRFLLDNGHGGVIDSAYQTAGKRSPVWPDGSQLFEGEFNRAIVNRIIEALQSDGIPYVNIAPEYRDVSLNTRVRRANAYNPRESLYISVHANAAPKKIAGKGHGVEIYTSPGETKSDAYATVFGAKFKEVFPTSRLRTDFSDGDLDKEAKFKVLIKTRMPALLTENFFMDNAHECPTVLMTRHGRDLVARYHLKAIREIAANSK